MSGHIGHHPGAECGGWAVLVRIGLGPLVWGDAVVAEKVADLLAGRLARDPHAGSGGTTIDEGADHVNPVAGLPGALAAANGVESNRASRPSTSAPASMSRRTISASPTYAAQCSGCSPKLLRAWVEKPD